MKFERNRKRKSSDFWKYDLASNQGIKRHDMGLLEFRKGVYINRGI